MAKQHTGAKLGTALGALLAAGAATYFFTQTKSGKQAAKNIKAHAIHLSTELTERVSRIRQLSQKKYNDIVDEIVDEYADKKKLTGNAVNALKKDLKNHWSDVQREIKRASKPAKRSASRAKTAVKRTAAKGQATKKAVVKRVARGR